jgi:hypothetical protein
MTNIGNFGWKATLANVNKLLQIFFISLLHREIFRLIAQQWTAGCVPQVAIWHAEMLTYFLLHTPQISKIIWKILNSIVAVGIFEYKTHIKHNFKISDRPVTRPAVKISKNIWINLPVNRNIFWILQISCRWQVCNQKGNFWKKFFCWNLYRKSR